jgi:hypothetical protein
LFCGSGGCSWIWLRFAKTAGVFSFLKNNPMQSSYPHHLRFAQPRGFGLKVSDEFTVPLCRGHHRQLHQAGNEFAWWESLQIDALGIAKDLWKQTHSKDGRVDPLAQSTTINSDETMAKH